MAICKKSLHCPSFWRSNPILFVMFVHFHSITRLWKTRSSRSWRWQMSNYGNDIHVSHLWPAWPAISPADAGCEMQELRLSIPAPGKAAWPILACHPSLVPHGCHSCVIVPPLPSSRRPLTPLRTHQQDDQISLWDKRQPSCEGEKKTLSYISSAMVTSLSVSSI